MNTNDLFAESMKAFESRRDGDGLAKETLQMLRHLSIPMKQQLGVDKFGVPDRGEMMKYVESGRIWTMPWANETFVRDVCAWLCFEKADAAEVNQLVLESQVNLETRAKHQP